MLRIELSIHDPETAIAIAKLLEGCESADELVNAFAAVKDAINAENHARQFDGEPKFLSANTAYKNAREALLNIGFTKKMVRNLPEIEVKVKTYHD